MWTGRAVRGAPAAPQVAPGVLSKNVSDATWSKEDTEACIVSFSWWKTWEAHAHSVGTTHIKFCNTTTAVPPGAMEVGLLVDEAGVDCTESYIGLKLNVEENTDFKVIPLAVGLLLHAQYGGTLLVHPVPPVGDRIGAIDASRAQLCALQIEIEFWLFPGAALCDQDEDGLGTRAELAEGDIVRLECVMSRYAKVEELLACATDELSQEERNSIAFDPAKKTTMQLIPDEMQFRLWQAEVLGDLRKIFLFSMI